MCDYYILIVGNRYGSISKKENKSFTELEFDYAVSQEIPILAFLVSDIDKKQAGKNIKELVAFRERVSEDRMVSFWKTKDELAKKVAVALSNSFKKGDRIGWIKSNENDKDLAELNKLKNEASASSNKILQLEEDLSKANEEIKQLTNFNKTLVFDQKPITIHYKYKYSSTEKIAKITIKKIFGDVSIHFINVMRSEDALQTLISDSIDSTDGSTISDTDLKKICMQFLALGLFYTKWFENNKKLYYGLTKKGEKMRDEMNLFTIEGE